MADSKYYKACPCSGFKRASSGPLLEKDQRGEASVKPAA